MLEEVGRENKDNKKPTIIGMIDAKSAFDVVRHANLIRRLYHYGVSKQCILMIDNLYRNATTKIKWKGEFSEGFKIEQGVRQGGTLSADLYKIYVNHLLDILDCAGVGAKIGSIKCCAPTCADDIALTGNNPQDIQTMINIAYDFSQREGYSLQPTKSVILPVKTCNKISHEDETWTMNNNSMPIVDQTAHIGIQRHFKDSSTATIEENLNLCYSNHVLWARNTFTIWKIL
jgi:hypothetical protein